MNPRVLWRIAWASVLLGLVMEVLILIAALVFGARPGVRVVLADTVQKVAWSTVVCLGLGIGTAAAKNVPPVAGVFGLVAGPIGFVVAKALHQGVSHALGIALGGASHPSAVALALLKGLQYGGLGHGLAWVGKHAGGRVMAYLGTGLAVGIVFGGITLFLMSPLATTALVTRGLNEILFPVGCSLVVYSAQALAPAPAVVAEPAKA